MIAYVWLALLGGALGAFGTLIGAGGGFLLMPILLIVYPHDNPDVLASISLAVVCLNATSGSFAYARMRRIDYKSGALFAAATIPGGVLGALTTGLIPRATFDIMLGVVVLTASAYLLINPVRRVGAGHRWPNGWQRVVVDASGTRHEYRYPRALGVAISLVVGFVSSVLGIGGGIIHVPVLSAVLDFPVHIATATSHFTLAFMSAAGTVVHTIKGTMDPGLARTLALAVGVVPGAQLGARLSKRIHGVAIIRALAAALALVGIRLLAGAM